MADHESHDDKPKHGHAHGMPHAHGGDHEEHEGAPEWLISFADNVALMMGFFIILLAMNMKEPTTGGVGGKEKNGEPPSPSPALLDSAIAIREAFNSPVDLSSLDPADAPLIRRILELRADGRALQPGESGELAEAQALRPTDYSSLGGVVPFADGVGDLDAAGLEQTARIAQRIAGLRWIIEVHGHSAPSETGMDVGRSMELSHQRAAAVGRALAERGVRWQQMRLVACGDNERMVARTYDREADRANQRVEVVVTDVPIPDDPYTRSAEDSGP